MEDVLVAIKKEKLRYIASDKDKSLEVHLVGTDVDHDDFITNS